MPQPPATGLKLSAGERKELFGLRRHRNMPQSVILRANIVLEAANGTANKAIARQLSTSLPTVLLWRRRYESKRLEGILQDQPRSGRPRRISDETIASIVDATMKTIPKDATHWSVRSMAKNQPR
jgi:transposase